MAIQEREGRQLTPEEIASQQIDQYIERVEKRPEIDSDAAQHVQPSAQDQIMPTISDDQGNVVAVPIQPDPEIELPLTQNQVEQGLHHKMIDSFRWLAEWCVMIIKKYPGRVFYKSGEQQ